MKPSTGFDESTHTYYISGRQVPHVTQVLADLLPQWGASEWHMTRGRAVHMCAALIARGQQFEHDPRIAGQVEAVRRFLREVKPEIIAVEQHVYSTMYHYAGTLDLLAGIQRREVVIDYKASLTPSTIYQLAAYALTLDDVNWGMGVEIHEDGSYRCSELLSLKRAKQEWLALLTAHNIRVRLGYTNKEDKDHE